MEALRQFYLAEAKEGRYKTAAQLASYAKTNGIKYTWEELKNVRHGYSFSAMASKKTRPKHFMTSAVPKYGVVMSDAANFMPEHKRRNNGAVGFLCTVECLSGQLDAVPIKDLTTKSWEKALTSVIEGDNIHAITTVVSDRDSAVTSENSDGLQSKLLKKYGIRWIFLMTRHKAFKVRTVWRQSP
jgi:hypothetical protein